MCTSFGKITVVITFSALFWGCKHSESNMESETTKSPFKIQSWTEGNFGLSNKLENGLWTSVSRLKQQKGMASQNGPSTQPNSHSKSRRGEIRTFSYGSWIGTKTGYPHTLHKRVVAIEEYHIGMKEHEKGTEAGLLKSTERTTQMKQKFNKLLLEHRPQGKGHFSKKQMQNGERIRNGNGRKREPKTHRKRVVPTRKPVKRKHPHRHRLSRTYLAIVMAGGAVGALLLSMVVYVVCRRHCKTKSRKHKRKVGSNNYSSAESDDEFSESYSEDNESSSIPEAIKAEVIRSESSNQDFEINTEDTSYPHIPPVDYETEDLSRSNCELEAKPEHGKKVDPLKTDEQSHGDFQHSHSVKDSKPSISNGVTDKTTVVNRMEEKLQNSNQMGDFEASLLAKVGENHSRSSNYTYGEQRTYDNVRKISPSANTSKKYVFSEACFVPSCYYTEGLNYSLPTIENNAPLGSGEGTHQGNSCQVSIPSSREFTNGKGDGETVRAKPPVRRNSDNKSPCIFDLPANTDEISQHPTPERNAENSREAYMRRLLEIPHERTEDKRKASRRQQEVTPNRCTQVDGTDMDGAYIGTEGLEDDIGINGKRIKTGDLMSTQLHKREMRNRNVPRLPYENISKSQLSRFKVEDWLRRSASESLAISRSNATDCARHKSELCLEAEPLLRRPGR